MQPEMNNVLLNVNNSEETQTAALNVPTSANNPTQMVKGMMTVRSIPTFQSVLDPVHKNVRETLRME